MPPYQPTYDGDEADAIVAAAAAPELEHEHEPELEHERERDDVDRNVCPDCGKSFASARGLAIHRGHVHPTKLRPPATNGKAAPAAKSAPAIRADTLRALVGMYDRAAELRDELAELEQLIAELQAQLAKAWTR